MCSCDHRPSTSPTKNNNNNKRQYNKYNTLHKYKRIPQKKTGPKEEFQAEDVTRNYSQKFHEKSMANRNQKGYKRTTNNR